jgi:MEDS: MEthanogen/methylotroph, DcmR Sensory domain
MTNDHSTGAQLSSALERFGPHDHLCSIYENQQDHFTVAVPFIRIGLERHEKCLYITDHQSMEGVRTAMLAGGIDVAEALASGALILATKDSTYMRRGPSTGR